MQPAEAVGETVRSVAVEASQRRTARHGMPRSSLDAGPWGTDSVTASPAASAESTGAAAEASTHPNRYDSDSMCTEGTPADPDSAGAAERGRGALQQPDRGASL